MQKLAKRLSLLPPYLFVEIDRKKKILIDKGVDIISLGVGDPDMPTPEHIVKSGQQALTDSKLHQYPFGAGLIELRQAIANWYETRFKVKLDPNTEIHALIGSKEGIGHLPLALVNPDDIVLVPDPGYPVYRASTIFAGGEPYFIPLKEENNFLPDLDSIPKKILNKAKLMFLNYPNNPTSAVATVDFFKQVVALADKYNIVVAHDAAYSEIYFDSDNPPASFLSVPGAKEVGVEFHSLSKTYNMTGWRIGWICGNSEIVKALATVKDNYDSGVFNVMQKAGITALTGSQECVENMRKTYLRRRDILVNGLLNLGWKLKIPQATFYVWSHCPQKTSSIEYAGKLLGAAGIVSTPGIGMGPSGEGYIRFALTVTEERTKEALNRISKLKP